MPKYLIISPSWDTFPIFIFPASSKGDVTVCLLLDWCFKKNYKNTCLVHPWLAAAAWNALRTTSTIRCDVKTFPPHTAAVRDGERRDLGGILTVKAHWVQLDFKHDITHFQVEQDSRRSVVSPDQASHAYNRWLPNGRLRSVRWDSLWLHFLFLENQERQNQWFRQFQLVIGSDK